MCVIQYGLLLFHGVTTFERLKDTDYKEPCSNCDWSGIKGSPPYNMGAVANFERMFGKGWSWLIPFTDYKDYGYEFRSIPVAAAQEMKIENEEPKSEAEYLEKTMTKYVNAQLVYDDLLNINNINNNLSMYLRVPFPHSMRGQSISFNFRQGKLRFALSIIKLLF